MANVRRIPTRELVRDDRPYAAWLYHSLGYHIVVDESSLVIEASGGIVGPWALGELLQNGWHDIMPGGPVEHANGWAHQLHHEPGLLLAVEYRRRFALGRWADAIPRTAVVAGNVHAHWSVGGEVRLGFNLPEDFGCDLIRAGTGNVVRPRAPFSFYLFGSMDGRAVARNIFLDGNSWQDSHSVRKRPLVWDLNAGLALNWRRFRLIYTQNYRSMEFYGQKGRDVFGSVSFVFLAHVPPARLR